MKRRKKILIFGGKRVLGNSIVKQISLNSEVFCVSRTPQKEKVPNVEYLHGDVANRNFLISLSTRDYDVLIDNLAYDEYHAEMVYEALKNNVSKYIMTSSSWVYKFMDLKPPFHDIQCNEADLNFPGDTLQDTVKYISGKVKAENKAAELWGNFIIVRLPMIFGENDHTDRLKFVVKRLLDHKPVILIDGEANKFQIAYAADIARLYESLCLVEIQPDAWLNLANPEIYTPKGFYELCANFLDISGLSFIDVDENEIHKTSYDYWQAEAFFREKNHLLNCAKLYRILDDVKFSKNTEWLRDLCLREKKEIELNPGRHSRFTSEEEFICSHANASGKLVKKCK